jgi:hypothetical protein
MTEQKHYSFQDGMPTGPDVTVLQKQWPALKVGDRIPYEEIEVALGIKRTSNRWASVTEAWRKREHDRGVVIQCDPGKAFVVATSEQIMSGTWTLLRGVQSKAKKHRAKLATVRPASELEKNTVEHHAKLMHVMEREAKKSRMNLIPDTTAKATPQIAPPAAKEKKAG